MAARLDRRCASLPSSLSRSRRAAMAAILLGLLEHVVKVTRTELAGVLLIEPVRIGDERGFFVETFQVQRYLDEAGIDLPFVQDNHSRSRRGVLRGLHLQTARPQGKLVRVARGEVFDVAADIDPKSPTFGRWVGVDSLGQESASALDSAGLRARLPRAVRGRRLRVQVHGLLRSEGGSGVIWNDPDLGYRVADREADAVGEGSRVADTRRAQAPPMTILVLGASGQAGDATCASCYRTHTTGAERNSTSGTPRGCRRRSRLIAPSFIVNAAAYTAVDKAETERDAAWSVNAEAAAMAARAAARLDVPLVHISTRLRLRRHQRRRLRGRGRMQSARRLR